MLGRARQPSSDAAWAAAAWSSRQKATGARRGGSVPADGERAARPLAPSVVLAGEAKLIRILSPDLPLSWPPIISPLFYVGVDRSVPCARNR